MQALQKKQKTWVLLLLGALLGLAAFLRLYGTAPLDPANDAWIWYGYDETDIHQHYAGWLGFRNSSWQFPLAQADALAYPAGTGEKGQLVVPFFFFKARVYHKIKKGWWQSYGKTAAVSLRCTRAGHAGMVRSAYFGGAGAGAVPVRSAAACGGHGAVCVFAHHDRAGVPPCGAFLPLHCAVCAVCLPARPAGATLLYAGVLAAGGTGRGHYALLFADGGHLCVAAGGGKRPAHPQTAGPLRAVFGHLRGRVCGGRGAGFAEQWLPPAGKITACSPSI